MTSSNRLRLTYVRETTPGTTPNTPRMRTGRLTGESLSFTPEYIDSDEIRSDRMIGDPMNVMQASQGGINMELSYPVPDTFMSDVIRSMLWSDWVNTPTRDNDGSADSVITAVTDTTDVFTVTTGAAFVAGQLLRATGFTNDENNGLWPVTTGGATSVAVLGAGLVAEAAPPAAARLKVVGFQGASGDITALADGLGSTSLDFTTLGLAVGMWVKIGGTADATTFAFLVTAGAASRRAAYARVIAIAATKLTLDNLPSGWTTDSGTSKTIQVFFGDYIKNGVTKTALTFERGFLAQSVPSYITNLGMCGNTMEVNITSRQKINITTAWMGMSGAASTTSLDASPDAETTVPVMAANANVGRVSEGGSRLTSPNWARSLSISVNNNLRMLESIDETSPVDINPGEFTVTGRTEVYFGDLTLLSKLYAGTPTSLSSRITKSNRTIVFEIPRATLRAGNPSASAKNTDVTIPADFSASKDDLTSAHLIINRMEYVV